MSEKPYTWVCAACGKKASTRSGLKDSSCYVNAVACKTESLESNGIRIFRADTYDGPTEIGVVKGGRP